MWGYAIWIAVDCFQTFVNTIIWHDGVNVVVPVWCDIGENVHIRYESYSLEETVSKLQVGASIGTVHVLLRFVYDYTKLHAFVDLPGLPNMYVYESTVIS